MANITLTIRTGLLTAVACAAFTGLAAAAPYCPASESFFGTIERVNGNLLNVRTPGGHGADVQINSGARINGNGTRLRPGAFMGAFGCVTPNGVFHASEITLSTRQSSYGERLTGVVTRIETGRLIVAQTGRGTGVWYVPDTDEFHAGQQVSAVGMIGANGAFYPQSIDGRGVAYDADYGRQTTATITLSGVVRRVRGNDVVVWEPAHRTTGTWVVPNAGARLRAGERVSATGTEDRRGIFYVQELTIL